MMDGGDGPLFCGEDGAALNSHFVGRAITRAREGKRFEIASWSAHDLRRTALTGMALRVSPHVIAHVANHRLIAKTRMRRKNALRSTCGVNGSRPSSAPRYGSGTDTAGAATRRPLLTPARPKAIGELWQRIGPKMHAASKARVTRSRPHVGCRPFNACPSATFVEIATGRCVRSNAVVANALLASGNGVERNGTRAEDFLAKR
jgi:hypothetical protein